MMIPFKCRIVTIYCAVMHSNVYINNGLTLYEV